MNTLTEDVPLVSIIPQGNPIESKISKISSSDGSAKYTLTTGPGGQTTFDDTIDSLLKDTSLQEDLNNGHLYCAQPLIIEKPSLFISPQMQAFINQDGAKGLLDFSNTRDTSLNHIKLKDGSHVFELELSSSSQYDIDDVPLSTIIKLSPSDIQRATQIMPSAIESLGADFIASYSEDIVDFSSHTTHESCFRPKEVKYDTAPRH